MEDKFKGKIAPIDKEAIWGNIISHEDFPTKSNSRKRAFMFFFGFALLLFGVSYFYTLIQPNQPIISKSIHKNILQPQPVIQTPNEKNTISTIENDQDVTRKLGAEAGVNLDISASSNNTKIQKKANSILWGISLNNRFGVAAKEQNTQSEHSSIKKTILTSSKEINLQNSTNPVENIEYKPLQLFEISPYYFTSIKPDVKLNRTHSQKWSIGIDYQFNINFNTFSSNNPDNELIWFYNQNLKVESHSSRILIQRNLKSKWSIGMGLMYSQVIQKFSITKRSSSYGYSNSSSSSTTPILTKTIIDSTSILFHHHHLLDALVSIDKQIQVKAFHINFGVGTGVNLIYNFKGNIRNEDFQLTPLSRDHFRKKLSPFIYGRIGFSRKLFQKMDITGGIEGQSTRQLSAKNSSLKNSYWQIRSTIGLKYNF